MTLCVKYSILKNVQYTFYLNFWFDILDWSDKSNACICTQRNCPGQEVIILLHNYCFTSCYGKRYLFLRSIYCYHFQTTV